MTGIPRQQAFAPAATAAFSIASAPRSLSAFASFARQRAVAKS